MENRLGRPRFERYYRLIDHLCQGDQSKAQAMLEKLQASWTLPHSYKGYKIASTVGDCRLAALLTAFVRYGQDPEKGWKSFQRDECFRLRCWRRRLDDEAWAAKRQAQRQQAAQANCVKNSTNEKPDNEALVVTLFSGQDEVRKPGYMYYITNDQGQKGVQLADDSTPEQVWQAIFWALEKRNKPHRELHLGFLDAKGYMWP